ncbi:MAG: TIGR03790 family protein [Phycisphaerales bacterium]
MNRVAVVTGRESGLFCDRSTRHPFRAVRIAVYFVLAFASTFSCARSAHAINAENVLVLYNTASPDGIEIALDYAQTHPGVRLLGLSGVSTAEQINQDHYLNVIRPQVLAGLTDEIDVIVTTKGLPLRIKNDVVNPSNYPGWRGEAFGVPILDSWWQKYSSLESELTRIDLIDSAELMGDQAAFLSPPSFPYATDHQASNPYFHSTQAFDRDNPALEGIRLAARLDGFTVSDVKAMIDRAQTAFSLPTQQMVILDDDPTAPGALVDRMVQLGYNVLEPKDYPFIYDNTTANITESPIPVIGYISHGKYGAGTGYIDNLEFELADGAVFHTWESYNAYSFSEGNNHYGQGLVGEWIAAGGTAALGHVHEPTASTATVANEDILWQKLLNGFTLAEAAWAATPQLSFVNTLIGDPLMVLKPWIIGDGTLDGVVGIDDLNLILHNWSTQTTLGAIRGDYNADGFVGIKDLNLLLTYWSSNKLVSPAAGVPEPVGAWCVLGGGLHLLTRRDPR